MVEGRLLEGDLRYRALERAMGESQIEESTRTKVREFVQDPQVVEMHAMLKESLGKSSKWNEVEYGFFETVADVAGDPTLEVKTRLAESMRFLVNESEPDGIAGFSRLLGVGSHQVGVDPRPGEGKLLKVVRGIEIRAASIDWTKEDGVYVGPPSKDYGTTIYHRDFVGQLDRELVRESLQGQRLYVQEKDQHHAEWLIAEFGLVAGQHLDPQGWKQILKRCCSRAMSLSLTGAILKLAIQCRPGEFWNFARALTCCALEAFQRNSAELLPLPLPPLDEAGLAIEDRIRSLAMESTEGDDEAWKAVEEVAPQIGETVWTWLQVLVTNFLYCQGVNGRMITEGMLHGKTPTKAQEEAILKLRQWSRKWLSGDQTNCIRADSWENLAESLGDLYTGPSLGKSYPLTLEAILPTTPGALEAARVALADVVSPAVRDYVNQPDLL